MLTCCTLTYRSTRFFGNDSTPFEAVFLVPHSGHAISFFILAPCMFTSLSS